MKTLVFVLAALLLVSSAALAGDPRKLDAAAPTPSTLTSRTDCIDDGYDCYMDHPNVAIPDDEPAGVLIGPIPTDPGGIIQDVLLYIRMEHTWIGDLIIQVYYSYDCSDAQDVVGGVLCRPGLDGCPLDDCCGCSSGDFTDLYGFDDTSPSIEDECPTWFVPGCYGPDYDSIGLANFVGEETGGCFWLHVRDGAGGDVGTVFDWEVCILSEPIVPPSDGAFDIKPTSCPNPFNVKAQGRLPAAVLTTETFDATYIDVETLSLECPDGSAEPIWHRLGDVATPVGGDPDPCECNELGPDGFMDLKLEFMRQDIVDLLGPFEDGDEIELTLTGALMDGTPFSLTDCIWILDKGKDMMVGSSGNEAVSNPAARDNEEPSSWATIKALYR